MGRRRLVEDESSKYKYRTHKYQMFVGRGCSRVLGACLPE